jgi:hypothetical protein
MAFLSRRLGPLPAWAYIAIVVIGGVVFYIWWRHYTSTQSSNNASQAQSTSGVAGANPAYNPLNPSNDPNIDPNTGVPYQLEEAINPNTGIPYYYSTQGTPGTPSAPSTPTPIANQYPNIYQWKYNKPNPDQGFTVNPNQVPSTPNQTPLSPQEPGTLPQAAGAMVGSGPMPSGRRTYTFQTIGKSGQTSPIAHVAMDEYGVQGTQALNAATQAIINANPSLRGKSYSYQPPAGTTITIPQL